MRFLCVFTLTILLTACATQPPPVADPSVPGFLYGLLHGAIAPLSLIAGLFNEARIYAFPNSGLSYDVGFLLGCTVWAGASYVRYVGPQRPPPA